MTEKDVKNCWHNTTIKMYLILKQLYWKKYALKSVKTAPIFQKNLQDLGMS